MDWLSELTEHVGIWVMVLAGLFVMWFIGGLPAAIKARMEKAGKKVPDWFGRHIVLIEIVWIVLVFWLIGSRIPL